MHRKLELYLLIYDSLENKKIQELIDAFQSISGLSPDILVSKKNSEVALRWVCDDAGSCKVSILQIVLEYIYVHFFNLLFSINKKFVVSSNAELSYLLLLGAYVPQIFPIETIADTAKFRDEHSLKIEFIAQQGRYSFYEKFQEQCSICSLIIEDILDERAPATDLMPILASYYQSSYALLQTVLFSDEGKPANWDRQFFEMMKRVQSIPSAGMLSWLDMIKAC